ncbi:CDP-alcohol phosphatidyltransferase-domain-containing protein [Mycena maculata]|uniref:CDP-alcohol phosphatidyltransferase-domain-containing protein n=1 Tax=Mycena maculata TaxID=230809 RepID=A0AAD7KAV9_9AGAR|nr:CDP-alcohol phosphatidyltransferase-domain-containing protein [Mycena maculata]
MNRFPRAVIRVRILPVRRNATRFAFHIPSISSAHCLKNRDFSRKFFCTRPPLRFPDSPGSPKPVLKENIYTLPNLLTVSRIIACPILGWSILEGQFHLATSLLVYAGLTDLADGYLARRFKTQTVLGTILDPAADKMLVTTLAVTLTMKGLLPLPLTVIILGRDALLSLSAFYIRYTSLAPPKTFARYWDFSLPSAEVRPTEISKVNTALQLLLMGASTVGPLVPFDTTLGLQGLQLIVGVTTVWSGLSYIFSKDAVRLVSSKPKSKPPL